MNSITNALLIAAFALLCLVVAPVVFLIATTVVVGYTLALRLGFVKYNGELDSTIERAQRVIARR